MLSDPYNKRIIVHGAQASQLSPAGLAGKDLSKRFSKLTVYAPNDTDPQWSKAGFIHEASIPGFFRNGETAEVWSLFRDRQRYVSEDIKALDVIVGLSEKKGAVHKKSTEGYQPHIAAPVDADHVSFLLLASFTVYPFPVSEEIIHKKIVEDSSRFCLVTSAEGNLVSVASAELDRDFGAAEMTDCATRRKHRGQGLIQLALTHLQESVAGEGFLCLYTLCRAGELGINVAFARLGYSYGGRLVKNCRMPDGWESMNVWYKKV